MEKRSKRIVWETAWNALMGMFEATLLMTPMLWLFPVFEPVPNIETQYSIIKPISLYFLLWWHCFNNRETQSALRKLVEAQEKQDEKDKLKVG
jgi:hypothetical protein